MCRVPNPLFVSTDTFPVPVLDSHTFVSPSLTSAHSDDDDVSQQHWWGKTSSIKHTDQRSEVSWLTWMMCVMASVLALASVTEEWNINTLSVCCFTSCCKPEHSHTERDTPINTHRDTHTRLGVFRERRKLPRENLIDFVCYDSGSEIGLISPRPLTAVVGQVSRQVTSGDVTGWFEMIQTCTESVTSDNHTVQPVRSTLAMIEAAAVFGARCRSAWWEPPVLFCIYCNGLPLGDIKA